MDDELFKFDESGAEPLPASDAEGRVANDGAEIWYASYGDGPAVILLHGGLGNAGNWGYQVPALVDAGYRVIVIDSRGHGRSTRDDRPFSYVQMSDDVLAVMDHLAIGKAAVIGWSDGACTALILADRHPERVSGVFFLPAMWMQRALSNSGRRRSSTAASAVTGRTIRRSPRHRVTSMPLPPMSGR